MKHLKLLDRVFHDHARDAAMVWRDEIYSYAWLAERITAWGQRLIADDVRSGTVVLFEGDFSPDAVAGFLAFMERGCIVAPLTAVTAAEREQKSEIAQAELSMRLRDGVQSEPVRLSRHASHPFYAALRTAAHPGLVLFSSGSSGAAKAAVHDFTRLLKKFEVPRHRFRTVAFLSFDHIGGINTLLYVLSNGGCLTTAADRSPDAVFGLIERYRAELLPVSPTFLTMALLSAAHERYDLSSLRLITYGTEPMPAATLQRWHALFPCTRLQQTYGLSEVGILRSKSRAADSLWVKVGGEGFATRVVDGRLEIKAESAMLGYLNAASPFTEDGWLRTDDLVDEDGEYLRFRGRSSDLIDVGGEKVYPTEVEDVIRELDNVAEVVAYGRQNAITGQVVGVRIQLKSAEDPAAFRARLRRHCRERLAEYKVPLHIKSVAKISATPRFKRGGGR